MTAFSQVQCGFFPQENNTNKEEKKYWAFWGQKKAVGFALPPVHMHKCTHIYALQTFTQGAVASLRAKPCALLPSRSKAMTRKDPSRLEMETQNGWKQNSCWFSALLLRCSDPHSLPSRAWNEGSVWGRSCAVLFLLSPLWGTCSSTRQPPAGLCAPSPTEMRGFGHRQGLCGAVRACEALPCKASKAAEYSGFVLSGWPAQGTFSCKQSSL